jgi:hypothetical protein
MPRRRQAAAQTDLEVIAHWIAAIEKRVTGLERPNMSSWQTVSDTLNINDPRQGMVVINAQTGLPEYYHDNEWRKLIGYAKHEFKVTADDEEVFLSDADPTHRIGIDTDMDGYTLLAATAYVTTVGSGNIIIQIENTTTSQDMLSTPIRIDSGELDSLDSSIPSVVNPAQAIVSAKDQIDPVITAIGAGAMGLGVRLLWGLILEPPV